MAEKKKFWLKLTICLVAAASICDTAVIPAMHGIFTTFHDSSIVLLNFIMSGPSLVGAFAGLLFGALALRYDKKTLLLIDLGLFAITAFSGLVDNIYFLTVMRALVGCVMGITGTLGFAIIAELFPSEKECSTMMGFYNASTNVIGGFFSFAGGYLAVINWHLVFYSYLIIVPVIFLVIAFVPKMKPAQNHAAEQSVELHESLDKKFEVGKLVFEYVSYFVFNALFSIMYFQVSMYFAESGIGGAVEAGYMTTILMISGVITGVLFGPMYMRLRQFVPLLCFLCAGIQLVGLAFTANLVVAGILFFIGGSGFGIAMTYYYMSPTQLVPAKYHTTATSLTYFVVGVSSFISPYVLTIYQKIMGTDLISPTLIPIGATFLIFGIFTLIYGIKCRKDSASA